MKVNKTHVALTKQAAKRRGVVLTDADAEKHAAIILKQAAIAEDDEFGQGFYDAAKEYFAN